MSKAGDAGSMSPPWVRYPGRPLQSMFWRQNGGEWYLVQFREWWDTQPAAVRVGLAAANPEPPGWDGFWAGWGADAAPGTSIESREE